MCTRKCRHFASWVSGLATGKWIQVHSLNSGAQERTICRRQWARSEGEKAVSLRGCKCYLIWQITKNAGRSAMMFEVLLQGGLP